MSKTVITVIIFVSLFEAVQAQKETEVFQPAFFYLFHQEVMVIPLITGQV